MTASSYERELKGILSGRDDVLDMVTRTCTDTEKESYLAIKGKPFIVTRAAASLGMDIIALRGDISFPLEVKSSIKRVIRTSCNSGRETEQAENMIQMCSDSGVLPVYAFRLKRIRGDSWRIFTLTMDPPEGIAGFVYRRLPKLRTTKKGNYVMEWDEGMPLSEFIRYLSS